jgi:hypothetical protein
MGNKQRGYVDIVLDKPRRLFFNTNALCELEDALQRPVTSIGKENVGIRELRAMLWTGLIHEDPELTIQQAGQMLEIERLAEIAGKVTEAINLAFPKSKGDGGKNPGSGPNGAGQN